MTKTRMRLLFAGIVALSAAASVGVTAQAAAFRVLHNFTGSASGDGGSPTSLTVDSNGNLYGRGSQSGNVNGNGMIFELVRGKKRYNYQVLYNFAPCTSSSCPDGSGDSSGLGALYGALPLVVDPSGNLYGVTGESGYDGGKVFELTASGTFEVLYTFCQPGYSTGNCPDGEAPGWGLTYDGASQGKPYDGRSPLYGSTVTGGNNGYGTIYKIYPNGAFQGLYSFCSVTSDCVDCGIPSGPLVVGGNKIYGTTSIGGSDYDSNGLGGGVVYAFNMSTGKEVSLHSFPHDNTKSRDGVGPQGLILGNLNVPGLLLGATQGGGAHQSGIVFGIDPATQRETIYWTFCRKANCTDGENPESNVTQFNGDVVGLANGGVYRAGVAYDIKAGGGEATLHQFCQHDGGECPKQEDDGTEFSSPLVVYGSSLFGVANFGGNGAPNGGSGTIFEITP